MAANDHLSEEEFRALRRLHVDEGAEAPADVLNILRSKRLVQPTDAGWSLTVSGRAEHLCELIRAFNGLR